MMLGVRWLSNGIDAELQLHILKLNDKSNLSMAISGVINQYSYDGSGIENIAPDPSLSGSVKQMSPDMSFGILYSLNDKLRIGLCQSIDPKPTS